LKHRKKGTPWAVKEASPGLKAGRGLKQIAVQNGTPSYSLRPASKPGAD